MSSDPLPRRLVAVLFADAVGFSRQTRADADETYRRLQACRAAFRERIEAHDGQLIDHAGDSVLAIFDAASDALAAASAVQESMCQLQAAGQGLQYRIGLNLGDVIQGEDGVLGDGVNVAARLESLAKPGEIWVSGPFKAALGGGHRFSDQGRHRVKNIDEPVGAHRLEMGSGPVQGRRGRPTIGLVLAAAALVLVAFAGWWALSDKSAEQEIAKEVAKASPPVAKAPQVQSVARAPVLIVLPFAGAAVADEQQGFADGITEDIITDLSGIGGLRVMSTNTAFAFKGKQVTARELAKEFKVDYVLEGRVRRRGDTLRVTAHLVEAGTGIQKWSKRYDRRANEIFSVQDELTAAIVEALALRLTRQEQAQLAKRHTPSLAAYDKFLEAQRLSRVSNAETNAQAQSVYREAIELDPGFGRAYGALAYNMGFAFRRGWTDTPQLTIDRALELGRKAVELAPTLPHTYWSLAYVHLMRKEFEQAERVAQRSVQISPSYADGYGLLALISNRLGKHQAAIDFLKKGIALNPYYTWDYEYNLGLAKYALGDVEGAVEHLERGRTRNPNVVPVRLVLIAAYVRADRLDDAEWEVEELASLSPEESISRVRQTYPAKGVALVEQLTGDLRKAGLRE